jgi:hypothetical protein
MKMTNNDLSTCKNCQLRFEQGKEYILKRIEALVKKYDPSSLEIYRGGKGYILQDIEAEYFSEGATLKEAVEQAEQSSGEEGENG